MSIKIGDSISLQGFELQNAKAHNLGSDPTGLGAGDKGLLWFNTSSNRWKYWNGTTAELKATDSDLLGGQNSAHHLARANHSGTQTAATVSDLAATVQAYRLDQLAAATSPITVPDGTLSTHAATKGQLDTAVASLTGGQTLKGAVRAAAGTNINIASAPSTIDGITPTNGDIFLLTAQSTGSQNGPYVWTSAGAAMTRATSWDTSGEAVLGSYWVVLEGTRADSYALLTNNSAITLGTTTPTFAFIASGGYVAGNGLTLTGTTFDVGAGTGISVAADSVGIDTAVVGRKVGGVIPASSSGIFSVSGAVVTVNHALNNSAPDVIVRFYTSPGAGFTQGERYWINDVASDANNVVLTFPSAPSANQYVVTILG